MTDGMFGKLINPETGQPTAPSMQQRGERKAVVSPASHPAPEEKRKPEKPLQQKAIKPQIAEGEELRLTLPLPTQLVIFLDQLERTIFLHRPQKFRSQQRLTKNSVIRAWLAVLQDMQINVHNVQDEQDLRNRMKEATRKKQVKV